MRLTERNRIVDSSRVKVEHIERNDRLFVARMKQMDK